MLLRTTRKYSTLLANKLNSSSSPYLQSHASNPVKWQEWNDETFQLAKDADKPIFLSIGYHTCHWCHVMNRESFSNQDVADILNENFIPVKVDKEERPDVDAIYMMFLQATTGRGGWPLNVFLAPNTLDPIFGGTYWAGPGVNLHQGRLTRFTDILNSMVETWTQDKDKVLQNSKQVSEQLSKLVQAKSASHDIKMLSNQLIADVVAHFKDNYDSHWGGFSRAPKFPCPTNLSFLLRHGDSEVKEMVLHTLKKMGQGGIKDQIGNGFARYSVTEDWNLPHFEKMLYDQALLLGVYVDSYASGLDIDKSKDRAHLYAEDIVQYLTHELQDPKGGFYSAQDADSVDSDGRFTEGAFYTWTFNEFQKALRPLGMLEADMLAMYWDVLETGNVNPDNDVHNEMAYKNVLSETDDSIEQVAKTFGVSESKVRELIPKGRQMLKQYREEHRQSPAIDTKIVASWNGLAIGALARAYSVCRVDGALDAAVKAASYLKKNNFDASTDILYRVPGIAGMAEDYAFVISGLIDLYEATFDCNYLKWAQQLQETQLTHFWDAEHGGFFSTDMRDSNRLIFRPKNAFDAAEPSANGVSATNLTKLHSILQHDDYFNRAQEILNCYSNDMDAQPGGYVSMMDAVASCNAGGVSSYVITGKDRARIAQYVHKYHSTLKPNSTLVILSPEAVVFFNSETYKTIYEQFKDSDITIHKCTDRMCEIVSS